jgi:hypothetical protein
MTTTLAMLPKILSDAGYERDSLSAIASLLPKRSGVDVDALIKATSAPSRANTLTRLFYMGRATTAGAAREALTLPMFDLLMQEKILVHDQATDTVSSICALVPAAGFYCVRDFESWATGKPLASNYVLGVGKATLLLGQFTVRHKGEKVLDLGTGQGFQAATASDHASSVIATDINPRALNFAKLAYRINDISKVQLREGSFFEPVEAEKGTFDLLISNPPFVIAPPHDLAAIGGKWIGDSFVQSLIERSSEFLKEGGWANILCNWHHPTTDAWEDRPRAWIKDRNVDAWLIRINLEDPRTYATHWLRESAAADAVDEEGNISNHLDTWLKYYESLNVGAISLGMVIMRKRTPGPNDPANWVRTDIQTMDSFSGHASDQIKRVFKNQDALSRAKSERDLLELRLAASPHCELEQRSTISGGTWRTQEATLRQTQGLSFPIGLDGLPATLLARMDGTKTARQTIEGLAKDLKADPNVAISQSLPFLSKMLHMTHLVVK